MTTCAHCGSNCELTDGIEIYPHRDDLAYLNFWICRPCNAFVGCHKNGTFKTPLGLAANQELRSLRSQIHAVIDPAWKFYGYKRSEVYSIITIEYQKLFNTTDEYHTAKLNIAEAKAILEVAKECFNFS